MPWSKNLGSSRESFVVRKQRYTLEAKDIVRELLLTSDISVRLLAVHLASSPLFHFAFVPVLYGRT
jgi:hypothetical protein